MSLEPAAKTPSSLTPPQPDIRVRSDADTDWSQVADFSTRFDHLVANELRSDMFVRIEKTGQLVPAHRFAIGSANKWLRGRVYGPQALGSEIDGKPVLVLSNLQPDACLAVRSRINIILDTNSYNLPLFLQFLRFLYTNDCPQLTADTALALLRHACPRYGSLPDLKLLCVSALLHGMSAAQVLQLHPTIVNGAAGDRRLAEGCTLHLQYFATRMCTIESAADGTNLFQLPVPALERLFDTAHMHILSEVVLFRGLLHWARQRLRQLGVPYGSADERLEYQRRLRVVCTGRLDLIRLSTLTLKQFNRCMDELEAPPAGSDCGYGPGFFTVRELRELAHRRRNKYIQRRCEPGDRPSDGDDSDSEIIEDPECKLPYHYSLREPMPMDQLYWSHCYDSVVPVIRSRAAFAALLSDSGVAAQRPDYYVGALAVFGVRPSDRRRQRVVLAGLLAFVGMNTVRSVQLLRDGECVSEAAGAGLAFRYNREDCTRNRCHLWLETPERLEPNAQYRLVVTVNAPGVTCYVTEPIFPPGQESPFVVPDVVAMRTTAGGDQRLVKTCNVNMCSLFYNYLWMSE